MSLFLIRHGQSEGNVTGRLQGWQDTALTPLGERQAARAALVLSHFLQRAGASLTALYSSPLQRAARTAAAIGQATDCPVEYDPGLREMQFGRVEGLTDAEWKARFPDLLPAWRDLHNLDFGWPEGETRRAFYGRITASIDAILARHDPDAHIALVSHGGVISSYLSFLLSGEWRHWERFPVANCSISHLTWAHGPRHPPVAASLLSLGEAGGPQNADADAIGGA
jgi:broad specificity phosphatase PhoE